MTDSERYLDLSLDDFRPLLEAAAEEAGVTLDFLMQTWNGRFATYNIGHPVEEVIDPRRGVHGQERHYKLIGRLKATTQSGHLRISFSPPTSCDPDPTALDEDLWQGFLQALEVQLEENRAPD